MSILGAIWWYTRPRTPTYLKVASYSYHKTKQFSCPPVLPVVLECREHAWYRTGTTRPSVCLVSMNVARPGCLRCLKVSVAPKDNVCLLQQHEERLIYMKPEVAAIWRAAIDAWFSSYAHEHHSRCQVNWPIMRQDAMRWPHIAKLIEHQSPQVRLRY